MPDLDRLRELTPRVVPPDLDELARVASRRGTLTAATSLVGAAGVAALVVALTLPATRQSPEPAPAPAPTTPVPTPAPTPAPGGAWSPERIKEEAESFIELDHLDDSGARARIWTVCVGRDCGDEVQGSNDDEVHLGALEISQDDFATSRLLEFNPPWHPGSQAVFDRGPRLLVVDAVFPGSTEWRYRLVDATSSADVAVIEDPVEARPGRDVMLLTQVSGREGGLVSLDEEAATIRPLDVPPEIRMWTPDLDQALWGVADGASRGEARQCAVWWLRDGGGFDSQDLDCAVESLRIPDMEANGLPPLEPGQMAAIELDREGIDVMVHVTTDGGRTWQHLPVEASGANAFLEAHDVLAGALE